MRLIIVRALSFVLLVVEVMFDPDCFVELLIYTKWCHVNSSRCMMRWFIVVLFVLDWC